MIQHILFFRKIFAIGLLLSLSFTHAANFDVYKTSILINDTQANDPLKLKQAFAQIIANNTGERMTTILNNSVFATANIKSGMKRSYFEKIKTKYLSEESSHHYWFYLVMKEDFVKSIIRQAGFSVLPHNREKIMLWLVAKQEIIEDGELKSKPLGYAYDNESLMYWINHWAVALGINTTMPEIDNTDKLAVTPSSIKNLSFEANTQAQNRYDINQSLLIYIKQNTQSLKVRSGYKTSGSDIVINHSQEKNNDLGVVLYSVMSDVAGRYADKYKIQPESLQQHTVQLVVNSLMNYDDVNVASKYLSNLSVIDSLSIVSASVGQMIITADLSISNEAFKQITIRDNVLSQSTETSINQLVFNFVMNQ